jgi:hypothetical protein
MNSSFSSAKKRRFNRIPQILWILKPVTLKEFHRYSFFYRTMIWISVSLSYWKGLTNTIDFSTRAGFNFPMIVPQKMRNGDLKLRFTTSWCWIKTYLNFRPYGDNASLAPFITAGVGGGYYTGKLGAYLPAGFRYSVKSSEYYIWFSNHNIVLHLQDVLKDNLLLFFGYSSKCF